MTREGQPYMLRGPLVFGDEETRHRPPADGLREAAQALVDHIEHGIGWIERGPSGMSYDDAEHLHTLTDDLRKALEANGE